MSGLVQVTREGAVALLRLNLPQHLNALNAALAAEFIGEAEALDRDPDVGCLVVTGSEKAFAAGADISEMARMSAEEMASCNFFGEWQRFADLRIPKIAAVNGYALGGGCELMMMCDFAVAGEAARFGQPEIKLGVMAGIGGTQRMARLIGRSRAMDMHLTGRMMGAAEALAAGLVARVVSDDQVLPQAMEAARLIAGYSRPAVRLIRDTIAKADEVSLAEGLQFERQEFHALFGTPDQIEGMTAFLEKRAPKFGGQEHD